jgi:hypothetical protein
LQPAITTMPVSNPAMVNTLIVSVVFITSILIKVEQLRPLIVSGSRVERLLISLWVAFRSGELRVFTV